jgi:SAM-dependent methyltransferase
VIDATRFDAIYSERRWWDRLTRENVIWRFHATLAAVPEARGKRVLDAGCGPGRYCAAFAERGAIVTGVDSSPAMIEQARVVAGDDVELVVANILDYQPAAPFDVVIANGFFDYMRDPGAVLRHFRTMTRGRLIATFPRYAALRVPFRKLWWTSHGRYVRFYTRNGIATLMRDSGFEVERSETHGPIEFVIAR